LSDTLCADSPPSWPAHHYRRTTAGALRLIHH
jgi:hypothetical protein